MQNSYFKYLIACLSVVYLIGSLIFIPYVFSNLIAFLFGMMKYEFLIYLHILFFLPLIYVAFYFKKYTKFLNFKLNNKVKYVVIFSILYALIVSCGLNIYYALKGEWIPGDVINIFVLGTYIIAPLVVIWAYSDWRSVHNKQVEKDLSVSSYNKMDEVINLIHGINFSLRKLKDAFFDEIDVVNFKIVEDNYFLLKEKHIFLISSLDLIDYLSIEIDKERITIDYLSEQYSSIFHNYIKDSKSLMEKIRKDYNLMRDHEDYIFKADVATLQTPLYSKIEDKFDEVSTTVVGKKFAKEFEELDQVYEQLSINAQFILNAIKTGIFVK